MSGMSANDRIEKNPLERRTHRGSIGHYTNTINSFVCTGEPIASELVKNEHTHAHTYRRVATALTNW